MKKSIFVSAILFANRSAFGVGIGSSNWGDGYSSGSDPVGGVLIFLACIFILLTAWINGKSSIKTIYIPTLIGGFILFLIFEKVTFRSIIGYAVLGFLLGQVLRLFFGHYFEDPQPKPASTSKDASEKNEENKVIRVGPDAKTRYLESVRKSNSKAVLKASPKPLGDINPQSDPRFRCESTPWKFHSYTKTLTNIENGAIYFGPRLLMMENGFVIDFEIFIKNSSVHFVDSANPSGYNPFLIENAKS